MAKLWQGLQNIIWNIKPLWVLSKVFENLGADALKLSYLPDILSQAGYSFKILYNKRNLQQRNIHHRKVQTNNMQAELSLWNSLVDFSLGYAASKNTKSKSANGSIRREKRVNKIFFQSMIDNYYKTAIYQHIKGEQEEIAKHIDKMLSKVNGIKVERLQNPMQNLRFTGYFINAKEG